MNTAKEAELIVNIPYVEVLGKKWFVYNENLTLQCAYCLNVQDRKILRDDNGLVIGVKFVLPQSHRDNCPQGDE